MAKSQMTLPLLEPRPDLTVSKAAIRAADFLGLTQSDMAEVLGLSRATASRLANGTYHLGPARKREWEMALLFIRMFRSLDALLGHGSQARTWLTGPNTALGGRRPLDDIKTVEGLVQVVQYLDAVRGKV